AAEAHYQLGNLDFARRAGLAGLEAIDQVEITERSRIELVNLLGKIALAAEEAKQALALFSETLALAQKSRLLREEAPALVNLGLAHMRAGALKDAEANLLLGTEKARESNDLSHLAFGNLNLGVLAHQRGELGQAIERYRACRSLFTQLGNRTQLARVLYNL